jgi:hypothetical protein
VASLAEFGSVGHLARRFASSLWPGGPGPAGEAWARRWLQPRETELWDKLPGPDRRHAVAVARRAATALGDSDGAAIPTAVLAAALLHDVGKLESDLGTFRRVGVTLLAGGLGRERVAAWADRPSGWPRRAGQYLRHDTIGRTLLEKAGSDPLTSTWAGEHHLPPHRWTVERKLAEALKAADDD